APAAVEGGVGDAAPAAAVGDRAARCRRLQTRGDREAAGHSRGDCPVRSPLRQVPSAPGARRGEERTMSDEMTGPALVRDDEVTNHLRAIVAPPADPSYWERLEQRIMARLERGQDEGRWWALSERTYRI